MDRVGGFSLPGSFLNGQQSFYSNKLHHSQRQAAHNHVRSLALCNTGFLWIVLCINRGSETATPLIFN